MKNVTCGYVQYLPSYLSVNAEMFDLLVPNEKKWWKYVISALILHILGSGVNVAGCNSCKHRAHRSNLSLVGHLSHGA